MRVPQVSDRIKEAPAQALRGVFAGIGQLLLITDKLRNKTPAGQQVPQARAPEPSETRADPAPAAPAAAPPPAQPPPAQPAPAPPPAQRVPEAPAAQPAPAAPPAQRVPEARDFDKTGNVRLITSEEAGPGAPLPNYEELSIASLRARLRNLDLTQLRQLAAYEKAHAARAEVMTMFERRIAKLEAEASADRRAEADAEAGAEARDEVAGEVHAAVEAEAETEA